MPEFRYQGKSVAGHAVQGVLSADSRRKARERIDEMCARQRVQITALQKKATYSYRARRPGERPVRGEHRAFCKEEVENALAKLGFSGIRVWRKWVDLSLKPPARDVALFIRICADLLRERLPYEEILSLLASDTPNRRLEKAIREIQQDLKDGKEGRAVYAKHADVLGPFAAYMLGMASTSGNMAEVYESTAKFLERKEEFRKSLRSALIVPSVVMLALFGALGYYVGYIFPTMAHLFLKFGMDLPPMTKATLDLSAFLRAHMVWIGPALGSIFLLAAAFFRTGRGRCLFDRWLIRVPVIGPLLHKTSIEIFARVFHALYSGSGENIPVLRIAAEACHNRFIERQVKEVAIPMMLKEGRGLVESLEMTGTFTPAAIARLRSGQESGSLRTTALQLANYYERETSYRMKNVVELTQVTISFFIMAVMLLLTMVSSETATIRPPNPLLK